MCMTPLLHIFQLLIQTIRVPFQIHTTRNHNFGKVLLYSKMMLSISLAVVDNAISSSKGWYSPLNAFPLSNISISKMYSASKFTNTCISGAPSQISGIWIPINQFIIQWLWNQYMSSFIYRFSLLPKPFLPYFHAFSIQAPSEFCFHRICNCSLRWQQKARATSWASSQAAMVCWNFSQLGTTFYFGSAVSLPIPFLQL